VKKSLIGWVGLVVVGGILLAVGGCGHTQPWVPDTAFQKPLRIQPVIGVEYVFDVNQFNYASVLTQELSRVRGWQEVRLTHDVADPACDYVIRGHFTFSRVDVENDFYYASIYCCLIPVLTQLPAFHSEGVLETQFEVYRKGQLQKTFEYKDVFWQERGLCLAPPKITAPPVLARTCRLFIRDFIRDFHLAQEGP